MKVLQPLNSLLLEVLARTHRIQLLLFDFHFVLELKLCGIRLIEGFKAPLENAVSDMGQFISSPSDRVVCIEKGAVFNDGIAPLIAERGVDGTIRGVVEEETMGNR